MYLNKIIYKKFKHYLVLNQHRNQRPLSLVGV